MEANTAPTVLETSKFKSQQCSMKEKSTPRSPVPVHLFCLHFMLAFAYISAHQEVNIPPEKQTNN